MFTVRLTINRDEFEGRYYHIETVTAATAQMALVKVVRLVDGSHTIEEVSVEAYREGRRSEIPLPEPREAR